MDMASISTEKPARQGRRRRLLIVDDEPHLARTLQILLGDEHDVDVVTSGSAARERLERDASFDAILCDLAMRDVSGMDLHDWLSGTLPDVAARMIFMTGGAYTPEARAFLDRVPNPRVEKPFRLEELQALVRDVAES
ncbi:Histidine kinase [Sandaracinus amylolyticus]|uniref:Histidine kinase n=2 Tax=Sandaracinus amylolyticus TaxID=927083 RepID=A0A0F6YJE3_9BACT|nr:Histidine kinase [Sandaracinus amylolyticus]